MFYLFRVSLANIKPASQKKALKKSGSVQILFDNTVFVMLGYRMIQTEHFYIVAVNTSKYFFSCRDKK